MWGKLIKIAEVSLFAIMTAIFPVEVHKVEPIPIPEPIVESVIRDDVVTSNALEYPPEATLDLDDTACFCSRYARLQGVDIPRANAWELTSSSTPEIGGGILFTYDHIAVIRAFLNEGFFVEEANRVPCEITTRIVKFDDPFIEGFISKRIVL